MIALSTLIRRVDDSLFASGSPLRLATMRVAIGLFAFVYLLVRAPALLALGGLPAGKFSPVGVLAWLDAPPPMSVHVGVWIATVGLTAGFVLGWRFRVTGPLCALFLLWTLTLRNSFGMIFHTENLLVLHVAVLGCSKSADVWSVDARHREDPEEGDAYGWPIRALAIITVLSYFVAGVAKLRNTGTVLGWLDGDVLRTQIAWDNLRKIELGDVHSPFGAALVSASWLFAPLALLSLVVELGAPLALLGRRAARIWVTAAWSFHVGVVIVMAIVFPYPLIGIAYLPFFDLRPWLCRLPRWLAPRSCAPPQLGSS